MTSGDEGVAMAFLEHGLRPNNMASILLLLSLDA